MQTQINLNTKKFKIISNNRNNRDKYSNVIESTSIESFDYQQQIEQLFIKYKLKRKEIRKKNYLHKFEGVINIGTELQ